jgi:DNA (cytosine-5)-methyltransferase 1
MQVQPAEQVIRGRPDSGWQVDLFCGPGGFATGFEFAGFQSALAVDFYPPAIHTYRKNHPGTPTILGDIREVDTDLILSAIKGKSISVVTAGVPCEGFSLANRNRGKFVDERNFLFLEFLRVAKAIQSPYVVLENVSGITGHSDGYFKQEITAGMEEAGYIVDCKMLDAQEFGVPQRRKRVFFIGRMPGWAFSWPLPSHGQVAGLRLPVTVADAILDLPPLQNDETITRYRGGPKSAFAKLMRGTQEHLLNHRAPNHPKKTIERIQNTKPGEPMYPAYQQRIRLDPDRPSPTVISGGIRPQFHYGHPTQPRGLSVRERARLQSFPDSYDFVGGLVQGRVLTGDAVPPLLAAAIATSIASGIAIGLSKDLRKLDEKAIEANRQKPVQMEAF